MRVGFGYDVHKFEKGRKLVLGGVEIPNEKGLLGHSDADVLVHAIVDALIGSVAKGDIGTHFQSDDDSYKNINSTFFLNKVNKILKEEGHSILNIDSTIVAQSPKLAPYIERMRKNISDVLEIDIGQVSVKATTEEGLGFTGRVDGIKAYAVVCVTR